MAGSSIFAPRILRAAGGSITIGSFQDNAMVPFRDYFVKEFASKTGITVNYNETNYDTWYQNCKNDGLNKTGAYDIYVMDDNWVPEFAAGKIVQSLDQLGLKANPDILPTGLKMGMWPPKSGAAHEGLRRREARALCAGHHRRRRDPLLQQGHLPDAAARPGTTSTPSPRRPRRRTCTAGRPAA